MESRNDEDSILVLAPVGRDAELARLTLCRVGMRAEACTTIEEMCCEIEECTGALLLTQEALPAKAIERLLAALDAQPPWSDLPVVVLVSRETPVSVRLAQQLGERANATFLERPAGTATLIRAMAMALRARRRQYELRDQLLALAEAREAEHQARALAEEAVRIRDEFLTSVAHDLKNPLGAIKGFAQLLQRQILRSDVVNTAMMLDQLGRVEGMAARVIAQIDELLDAARLQAGQPLPLTLTQIDLAELAERVARDAQEMSDHHSIHLLAPSAGISGTWDPRRLERALSNLLDNAIKYSPDGGDITVRLEQRGNFALLIVHDDGIGIPAQDLPHIFTRFHRASNAAGLAGTGLGLAGVRQIVEQHGGSITIESQEGLGTGVTVRLPTIRRDIEG